MSITITSVTAPPDRPAFEQLLLDYARTVLTQWHAVGGAVTHPEDMVAQTMANLSEYLPPRGRLLLAHAPDGSLIGCGMLRKISPEAAEFKRLFVRPQARRTGLGRRLFEQRISEAKRMGCRVVFADTVKGNTAMLTMYHEYGFRPVARYSGNANPETMADHLVFLRYDIPQNG